MAENTKERKGLIASNGYVLVFVGKDHHLADVRGYAYEHRLVAESKIGRMLKPGEQVHHINGDKQDNRKENLEVCASLFEHRIKHRKIGSNRMTVGELNTEITCGCGCGKKMSRYDKWKRPRRFVPGHNPGNTEKRDQILRLASRVGVIDIQQAASVLKSTQAAKVMLSKLSKQGFVKRLSRGCYARN